MLPAEEHHRILLAAQGYCELAMFEDALSQLSSLPPEEQELATTVEMRLIVLMQAKRWKEALAAGRRLTVVAPEKNTGYIHSAFCLHELGQTEAACAMLLNGPASLRQEPVFHYNLACYECVLGRLAEAREHLERSIQLDKKFREHAKTDPDLKPLWAE
jgi:predicted Zn-dependent protease